MSPSENSYQSSPEKLSSTSGSEGSSPSTLSADSSSPIASENYEGLTSSSLQKQFTHISRDGKAQLQIITQPEQQHRARYQTEGSRGAVKDRSGNGFPVVRLNGYNKPTTLQVNILATLSYRHRVMHVDVSGFHWKRRRACIAAHLLPSMQSQRQELDAMLRDKDRGNDGD